MATRASAGRSASLELDELTLRRAQTGDHGAFRALVERYRQPVWGLIWRMVAPTGRADRADDLTQDAFLRVFRAVPGFDARGPARPSTWILTIATRLALNELRAARGRPSGGDDDEAIEVPAETSPRRELLRRELGSRLAAALAALPDDARAAPILRDLHGLEHDENARALDLELGTVTSRLARARAAVRARLAAAGDLP